MQPSTISANVPDWFLPSVAALLAPRVSIGSLKLAPIPGGSNNRVFRVDSDSGSFLVKWYFTAADDPRNRLQAEWQFADFAWRHGVRGLPEPVAYDEKRGIAVFEFLFGRRLAATDANREHVQAALDFLLEVNRHRDSPDARSLPNASESCFSIAEHLDCIRCRVEQLQAATAIEAISLAARDFFHLLVKSTRQVEAAIRKQLTERQRSISGTLTQDERIISPSDFGFHNAFANPDGRLRFFDFEYSGWDDPAKLVCDFFLRLRCRFLRACGPNSLTRSQPSAGRMSPGGPNCCGPFI